jgi:hypothetical protein
MGLSNSIMSTMDNLLIYVLFVYCVFMTAAAFRLESKLKAKKSKYVVYQMCHTRTVMVGGHQEFLFDVIIRTVNAETEEQAIGLFVKNTENIKAEKRLNIQSFKIEW